MLIHSRKFIFSSIFIFIGLFAGILISPLKRDTTKILLPRDSEKAGTIPDDWNFQQRAFPFGKIDKHAFARAYRYRTQKEIQNKSATQRGPLTEPWNFAGPVNVGGRITDIEITNGHPQLIFAGAASGGIFRSSDWGITWTPIFDDAQSLSIGDIAIAPSDQHIIYAGTGEPNAGGGSVAYDGDGVYKSVDSGDTWTHLGLDSIGAVGRIVVSPTDPNVCYVGAMGFLFENNRDRGVFKSQDGGQSWQKILFINDSTGIIDLAINPQDPNIVYAAAWQRVRRIDQQHYGGPSSGIYKTINGGVTWQKISTSFLSTAGRIGLAISASNPNILVAAICNPSGGLNGIYKTENAGDDWVSLNSGDIAAQPFSYWFGRIYIHPTDPDVFYYTNYDMYKTINGGETWETTFSWAHGDQHTICFNPFNPDTVLLGNDGGLYFSETGGDFLIKINNLPITQFYSCEIDPLYPKRLFGGAQDNGTQGTYTGNLDDWEPVYDGDGFRVKIDPTDNHFNHFMYAEYQYGNFARSTDGGASFIVALTGIPTAEQKNWNTPIELDPTNPAVLYYGGQRVYKSTNRAVSWSPISPKLTDDHVFANIIYGTLTAISASPANAQIIYAGSDDGHLHVTLNGGNSWNEVSATLPDRWVTAIEADPLDANTAYVTFSGYRFGSNMAHIYKTTDLGQTWSDISGDLPDIPINDIIVTPSKRNLYIATDVGVFYSINDGFTWELVGTGLPNVIVTDISYNAAEQLLLAATYGRGMYKISAAELPTLLFDHQKEKISIIVSPNPTSGLTTISSSTWPQVMNTISIFDINGSRVLEIGMKKNNQEITFDASVLVNGVYFLSVSSTSGQIMSTIKFIKL